MNPQAIAIANVLCKIMAEASRRKSTSTHDVVTIPVELMLQAQKLIKESKSELSEISPVRLNYVIVREF